MGDFEKLSLEIEEGIALVTLCQPEVLNALDGATVSELKKIFAGPLGNDDVGVVILTGAGDKAFVAGADIRELAGLDPLAGRQASQNGHALMREIENFPKPVIAAINGFCLGGGCELALACHMRVAGESAKIGLPEVKLGLIPGYGGTQRLSRLVGKGRAMEMILSGEGVTAPEAASMGLVNQMVKDQELIPKCRELAGKILSNAPLSLRYSIEAINHGLELPLEEANRMEATFFGLCCATEDMKEGTRAFLEKRPPKFQGK